MNRIIATVVAASAIAVGSSASAQARIETSIRSGTPVVLRTAEPLIGTDAQVKVGRTFALELAQPIESGGTTAIPAGTSATATIVSVTGPVAGQPGRIVARLQDLRFANRRIRLAGGLEGTGMGTASIPAGLTVRGYVDEDVMPDLPPVAVVVAPPVVVAERVERTSTDRPVIVMDRIRMPGRDRQLTVVANGTRQGSPALVALAPSTAIESAPTIRSVTVVKTVRPSKPVPRNSGMVDEGGVVTRYTY